MNLLQEKLTSKTTSQLSRSIDCIITVSTNPTKFTTQKTITNLSKKKLGALMGSLMLQNLMVKKIQFLCLLCRDFNFFSMNFLLI